MALFLKTIEKHHHISIVENEEYSEDVATMFYPQFENLFSKIFDEFLIDTLLRFQHINDVEHLSVFYICECADEVLEV